MAYIDFIAANHKRTKRNYLARVVEYSKAEAAKIAKQFGKDYWDGDRRFGYGGYQYDGRWQPVARALTERYQLRPGHRVLDVGCGKGFLLFELSRIVPDLEIVGLDISEYAVAHGKEEIKSSLRVGDARHLPFETKSFDLVLSIMTLHNLYCFDLAKALQEIERVGRAGKYVVVESYRTEEEKMNLLYWQLTCECFFTPEEWTWWFGQFGYSGDYSFAYFE